MAVSIGLILWTPTAGPLLGITGYTRAMKTAISVPDDVFREADRAAAELGWSRSQLYTRAMSEFLERRGVDPVTAALDALAHELRTSTPSNTGRALIDAGDWEW
jgi:predicted transcriptional regulator